MGSDGKRIEEGEGSSGVKKLEIEDYCEVDMWDAFSDPTVKAPPRRPAASEPFPPYMITQQVRREALQDGYLESSFGVKMKTVRFSWDHSGNDVAIIGSWDNWKTTEALQNVGEIFETAKTLPVDIYKYRFVVDGYLTYAPELPWAFDDAGHGYNILDLMDYIPEKLARPSDFESSPSPPSSYDNKFLSDEDFRKPPPEIPPQMPMAVGDGPSSLSDRNRCVPRPTHLELNHLYIHRDERQQYVELRSTQRFQHKYITLVLYKSLRKQK